ncbi:MAG: leucyl aminopeptidase [Candidatus Peregrinibacteria bacterium]|nr:leucyl aminopeptidase [Candidatus Peregrinibacteria bacterium]
MEISTSKKLNSVDGLFIFVPEKKFNPKDFGKNLPTSIKNQISTRLKDKDFEGKIGEVCQVFPVIKSVKKVFLVGLGKEEKKNEIRRAAGAAMRQAKKMKLKKISFIIPNNIDLRRILSGAVLGDYEFKIAKKDKSFSPKSLEIMGGEKTDAQTLLSEYHCAESTNLVRDLINLPPNMMTPKILAAEAKKIGKGVKNPVKVKIMGEKEMKKMGMGSLLGVGLGSHEESQLIVLEYNGGKKSEKPVALVGKAVCFDAGGYNLKPTKYIEEMKSDMSGGATVLGLFKWIAEAKPKKNIVGVVGAVENLVSGNAFKPGDILTAMNGMTIEIGNTDAEGRLVLADCLYYTATKYKPAKMMDIATLTGAVVVALGNEITGIMGNNPELITEIKESSEKADEMVWELPITDTFRDNMKGTISDLNNISKGVGGGSSNGGAFLENFVNKTPWAHLDLGGTAFKSGSADEITQKGATGVIVRTLKNLLKD